MPDKEVEYDASKLFDETPEPGDPEPKDEKEPEVEAEPEVEEEADDDAESGFSLEELEEMVARTAEKATRKVIEDVRAEADIDPKDREIAELRAKNEALEAATVEAQTTHEVQSAIGKLKMTKAEVEATTRFFEKNPDLVDVWSFERAALRVNPELRDRNSKPTLSHKDAGKGSPRVAEVVTRGGNGHAPSAPAKTTPKRGYYDDVTRNILASGAARGIISVQRD